MRALWKAATQAAVVLLPLFLLNIVSRRSLVDESSDIDVSMTTFGRRTRRAFYSIEAIGRGRTRPRRVYLWLDEDADLELPRPLRRLVGRGLQIVRTRDIGPFKKYYPYLLTQWDGRASLVTADDDVIYPPDWLFRLDQEHQASPGHPLAYRAHRMIVVNHVAAPYDTWPPQDGQQPSFATFGTGMGGILYPPAALTALRAAGDGFITRCPRADDVWIHRTLVAAGIRERLVDQRSTQFPELLLSQHSALWRSNLGEGRNDEYVREVYGPAELAMIETDTASAEPRVSSWPPARADATQRSRARPRSCGSVPE